MLGVDGARLLVVGDPRVPLDGLQRAAGERAEWRLGYLPDAELERALSESTVGLFPYRAEVDLSGALLQVLGAGVPAIVYDIGGLGEVVGRFGAGAVVPPGDAEAMSAALARLLERLRRARCGQARRGAGAGGADVGRLCGRASRAVPGARVILRRGRFGELVERQLDLFASETDLLEEATDADSAWTNAAADETEELYGDFQLVVDAIGERLYDIRETYAATLEAGTADQYRARIRPRRPEALRALRAVPRGGAASGAHRGLRAHR